MKAVGPAGASSSMPVLDGDDVRESWRVALACGKTRRRVRASVSPRKTVFTPPRATAEQRVEGLPAGPSRHARLRLEEFVVPASTPSNGIRTGLERAEGRSSGVQRLEPCGMHMLAASMPGSARTGSRRRAHRLVERRRSGAGAWLRRRSGRSSTWRFASDVAVRANASASSTTSPIRVFSVEDWAEVGQMRPIWTGACRDHGGSGGCLRLAYAAGVPIRSGSLADCSWRPRPPGGGPGTRASRWCRSLFDLDAAHSARGGGGAGPPQAFCVLHPRRCRAQPCSSSWWRSPTCKAVATPSTLLSTWSRLHRDCPRLDFDAVPGLLRQGPMEFRVG